MDKKISSLCSSLIERLASVPEDLEKLETYFYQHNLSLLNDRHRALYALSQVVALLDCKVPDTEEALHIAQEVLDEIATKKV